MEPMGRRKQRPPRSRTLPRVPEQEVAVHSYPSGADHHDHAVDFGGLRYGMYFGPRPTPARPPSTPPPAARGVDDCACPSCHSEGWYAQSPLCRYWRRFCDACRITTRHNTI